MDENALYQMWVELFQKQDDEGKDWIPRIRSIADNHPDTRSLDIPFDHIFKVDTDLADEILNNPKETIGPGESAITSFLEPDQRVGINLRIFNLPKARQLRVSKLRAQNLSKLLSIAGLVTKATSVRPKVLFAVFKCNSCGYKQELIQDAFHFTEPLECPKTDGGCGKRKGTTNFLYIEKESLFIDDQKIEIQEPQMGLKSGEHPQRISVILDDDMCGEILPGDSITATGILKAKHDKGTVKGTVFTLYMNGNHIEQDQERKDIIVTQDDIDTFNTLLRGNPIDILLRSFASNIEGNENTKLAMICQMVAGSNRSKGRDNIHILLVGDPGTGKTALATEAYEIMPRAQWVEKSTTEAGLNAAAVKSEFAEGRYTLEAGAMVLADGSIIVMDDIHTWKVELLDSLLGPLERQVITVHKADIHADLPCRTSVICLCNPKGGRFQPDDLNHPLIEKIDTKKISDPFRDRMDFVTGIHDEGDEEKDRAIVDRILRRDRDEIEPEISTDLLRKYIWYVKNKFNPIIPKSLDQMFADGYIERRFKKDWDFVGDRKQLYTRHIESCMRFAKASAKIRRSDEVNEEDINLGWLLIMDSLKTVTAEEDGRINLNALTSHMGSSKESMTKGAYDILKEMEEEENGRPVDKEEWITRCAEVRVEVDDKFIQTMMDNKMIFEPSTEMYKTLR